MNTRTEDYKQTVENRRALCATCEHRVTRPLKMDTCGRCGCFIYGKTVIPTARCPLGKW